MKMKSVGVETISIQELLELVISIRSFPEL
jgi:hypothetical protein